MRVIKPLDVNQILSAGDVLHVVTTDAHSGEARIYNQFRNIEHFFAILKASITIPIMAGAPVDRWMALGWSMAGWFNRSRCTRRPGRGFTHIGADDAQTGRTRATRPDAATRLRVMALAAVPQYEAGSHLSRQEPEHQRRAGAYSKRVAKPADRAIVRPAHASNVDRLTTDTTLLWTADREAQRTAFDYLDGTADDEKSEAGR
jgi:hypothetical protein